MKMGELNVEIEICCRAEFITYACEILRKSVKVFCRFLNFFTERGEKRVSGFQSIFFFDWSGFDFFFRFGLVWIADLKPERPILGLRGQFEA